MHATESWAGTGSKPVLATVLCALIALPRLTCLSHDSHMTLTRLSHDSHTTLTRLSHDSRVTYLIGPHAVHDEFVDDQERAVDTIVSPQTGPSVTRSRSLCKPTRSFTVRTLCESECGV